MSAFADRADVFEKDRFSNHDYIEICRGYHLDMYLVEPALLAVPASKFVKHELYQNPETVLRQRKFDSCQIALKIPIEDGVHMGYEPIE